MTKKVKALVLLSGGLDSMLAAKVLQEQGIQVTGLTFQSYFFGTVNAKAAAKQLKIPLKTVDFGNEHLKIVKSPPHGHGKAANPCIDCHLLMLQQSKIIMEKGGYDFVATGEVLGERPFSQNKPALLEIAVKSGLGERLLRPLSAAFLPKTLPEKRGWVDTKKLPAIKGRSRQIQLALTKKFGLKSFPQPAGGCLLTDPIFGKKLLILFEKWPQATGEDAQLLKLGRQFWQNKILIVLGRNQEENKRLKKLAKKTDALLVPQNFPGPSALLRGAKITAGNISQAKKLILQYSKQAPANHSLVPDISARPQL